MGSNSNFNAAETSDGTGNADGHYSVALPDSRIQHVDYHSDPVNGYVAEVTYDGTAAFPPVAAPVAVAHPVVHAAPVVAHAPPATPLLDKQLILRSLSSTPGGHFDGHCSTAQMLPA